MKNHYLYINKNESGDIEINSSDAVFSSIVRRPNKEAFQAYCEEKAHEWLTSKSGNYRYWNNEKRKTIADKWIKAKELREGRYEYYFNFGTIQDIFREEVADLAKSMGINYNLTVE